MCLTVNVEGKRPKLMTCAAVTQSGTRVLTPIGQSDKSSPIKHNSAAFEAFCIKSQDFCSLTSQKNQLTFRTASVYDIIR